MARFVAKSALYRVIVQGDKYMTLADGQRELIQKPLVADFQVGILTADEVEVGINSFVHKGLPEEPGTEQDLSPRPRISGFDTLEAQRENGWTNEERIKVEETLRGHHMLGIEFKELTPEPTAIPFPTFNDLAPQKLVAVAVATGTVEQALAYESENRNDPDIVAALEDALLEVDEPVVISA